MEGCIDTRTFGPSTTSTGYVSSSPKTSIGYRPLGDRVLIRQVAERDEIKNGLIIPDVAKERPLEGEVLAVGNGRVYNGERIPIDIQVGQHVTFGRWSGNEILVHDQKLLLLNENEIQGYYED